jgi:enoyl-CoA hydratase
LNDEQLNKTFGTQEEPMNADVLTTRAADGIAVITLGSAKRIYFDAEMSDALTEALDGFAGDPNVRVVIVTGGAPGYFNRHFNIPALIQIAESLRASGRQWPENATYNGGFFDKAMALCESMPKPVIAAISGTALAGAFEFALSCDLRIAEDGDYLIGLPEAELGLLPGAGGTQRLPRTIGTPAALMHILMGQPLNPREAERKGLVHETVSGQALDRAMEIARRLSSHTPESLAYIKRLVRNATETPLAPAATHGKRTTPLRSVSHQLNAPSCYTWRRKRGRRICSASYSCPHLIVQPEGASSRGSTVCGSVRRALCGWWLASLVVGQPGVIQAHRISPARLRVRW